SKFMESAYAGYLEFFRKIHTPSPEKSNVYIFRNYEEYLTMAGRSGVAGFYTPKGSGSIAARSVTAYHGGFGTTGGTDEVLLHELTHQFEHLVIGDEFWNAPIWLIEGLAVFFEACEIKGGKAIYKLPGSKTIGIVPRERLILLKAQIKAGNYDKLKKLIRTPQARFGYSQYTAAWSVIHWMWNADGGKYKSIFYTLWKTSRQKRIEPEFVEKLILDATGKDIEEFEEKIWKPYVVKLEALPPGIIKGNRFVSRRMKLEISRPKGPWKWDMEELPAELQVRLRNETADVTIEVSAIMTRRSGDELKEKGVDGIIDEAIEEIKTRVDNDLYDPADPDNSPAIAYKELNLRGFRAGRFEYDIKASFQSFDDDEEESTTRFLVVIPTVKRYFEFRCECPKEKAKQVRVAFDELVRSVRIAK
ncbi:MAG: DUF1570 domain-containing protein, partial [Planctomycetota bacterium]|nr:DUF1570 domain-containing protein [Planctomycetota bacterium]